MKITLNHQEIELAVRNYVNGLIALQPGTDIAIDFSMGRGENPLSASVDINYLGVTRLDLGAGTAQETVAGDAAGAAPAAAATTQPVAKPRRTAGSLLGTGSKPASEPVTATETSTGTDAAAEASDGAQAAAQDDSSQADGDGVPFEGSTDATPPAEEPAATPVDAPVKPAGKSLFAPR